MVEFSDDDDQFSTIKSKKESPIKVNKKKDLEVYIEQQRKRKFNEEALRLKREAILRRKRNKKYNMENSMDDGTTDSSYITHKPQEVK